MSIWHLSMLSGKVANHQALEAAPVLKYTAQMLGF